MTGKQQLEVIMEQMKSLHTKTDESEKKNVERGKKIDDIYRGLYGDKLNNSPGLIEQQADDDLKHLAIMEKMGTMKTDVNSNTKFRKKISNVTKISGASGGTAGVVSVIAFFKEIKLFIIQLFSHG